MSFRTSGKNLHQTQRWNLHLRQKNNGFCEHSSTGEVQPWSPQAVGLWLELEHIATANANAEKKLQNARALFESHLQSVFTQRGDGWVEKKLDDVCEVI